MHFPPSAKAIVPGRDGKSVIANAASGQWTDYDKESRRHDYVIELAIPQERGSYGVVISSVHLSSAKDQSEVPIGAFDVTAN
jgi:hypothetical protein